MRTIHLANSNFQPRDGYLYSYALPLPPNEGDSNEFPDYSLWIVYENDRLLTASHALHADIKNIGHGRYSHWNDVLYISASDNSDPRINGKAYTLSRTKRRLLPAGLHKGIQSILMRRHSCPLIVISCVALFIIRSYLLFRVLLYRICHREATDRAQFQLFYAKYIEMSDTYDNGRLFTLIFMKYIQRYYFNGIVPLIREPSLEIGVFDGITSKLYFDYSFALGTELFFEHYEAQRAKLPHKELKYFNIINYTDMMPRSFSTIVMVHSIDDFTSENTQIIFDCFNHLLKPGGKVYFSGYTYYWKQTYTPYTIVSACKSRISFASFRNIHETNLLDYATIAHFAQKAHLRQLQYCEFNKDPLFIRLFALEDYISKLFYVSKIRKYLWKIHLFKDMHIWANTCCAKFLLDREQHYAQDPHRRGINYFCVIEK